QRVLSHTEVSIKGLVYIWQCDAPTPYQRLRCNLRNNVHWSRFCNFFWGNHVRECTDRYCQHDGRNGQLTSNSQTYSNTVFVEKERHDHQDYVEHHYSAYISRCFLRQQYKNTR